MSTPAVSDEVFARVVTDLDPREMLKLAISIRDSYVKNVRETKAVLNPERLRGLDDSIARLRAAIN